LIALAANNPFLVYSFLHDIREDPNFALEPLVPEPPNPGHCGPISTVSGTFNYMSEREVRKQKRLDSWTKGLLEAS
jgi:hypothetical protein